MFLTGASSGIGAKLFETFSNEYSIYAPDRASLNLSTELDLSGFEDKLSETDLLVLVAGSDVKGKIPLNVSSYEDIQHTMQVNFLSQIQLAHKYTQLRIESKLKSRIVYVGSTSTSFIWPTTVPYSVSKLATEEFLKAMHFELQSQGVSVSIVRPGLTKTNFNFNRFGGNIPHDETNALYNHQPHLDTNELVEVFDLAFRSDRFQEFTITAKL